MNDTIGFKLGISAFFVALYLALFWLTNILVGVQAVAGLVTLVFLPAFVRLMAFLVVGFWTVPILFTAGIGCVLLGWYDMGPGIGPEIAATAATSVGAPLGIWIAMYLRRVQPDLARLSAFDLLWLSVGSSLGSALFLSLSLHLTVHTPPHHSLTGVIFVGDALGTWIAILLTKAALTLVGRLPLSS